MFGKMIDGAFVPAPDTLIDENGATLYLPTDATYLAFGYLPVEECEGEGTPTFTEQDGLIVQGWQAAEPTLSDRAAALEAENKKLQAKLSMQEEQLAMLEDCLLELGDEIYG